MDPVTTPETKVELENALLDAIADVRERFEERITWADVAEALLSCRNHVLASIRRGE